MTEQTPANAPPEEMIQRLDGSYVKLSDLEPRHQLAHDLVLELFPSALEVKKSLADLKSRSFTEMRAYRDMMLQDYGVSVGGPEGGFSIKSACGTKKVELSVSKHVSFGSELTAAKKLLDEFLVEELKGSSEAIAEIVTSAFKLNSKGRLDTGGILDLKKHNFDHPLWKRAMAAIEDAIIRDCSTTYVRFYEINPDTREEKMVTLDLARVAAPQKA